VNSLRWAYALSLHTGGSLYFAGPELELPAPFARELEQGAAFLPSSNCEDQLPVLELASSSVPAQEQSQAQLKPVVPLRELVSVLAVPARARQWRRMRIRMRFYAHSSSVDKAKKRGGVVWDAGLSI
jgi:hypothetical protein